MVTRPSPSPELSVADRLHDEIARLRAQVESLKNNVRLQTATLMTADSTRQILQSQTTGARPSAPREATKQKLFAQFQEQSAHKQRCLYRTCASLTTFKVNDPDPNAVDGGNVLGLRFEIMSKAKFVRPYYVMLNRPYPDRRLLRVHRHTVPQCIPLSGLAARHLPLPTTKSHDDDDKALKKQDLSRFVRALRRELVRYHNRAAVIGDMKKAAGLNSKRAPDQESETDITDISAADAEAKQISLQWRDGRSGRLVINDDGEVLKMVVQGGNGRDHETVREFLGGAARVEEVTRRLKNS